MFLVRIFTVDFYMSPPISGLDILYSEFRGASIQNVPIIRIFGSTEQGVKTCLHIHGAFPYIYIPFEGSDNADTVMHQIAVKLDQAINTSFGKATSNVKHIYKIALVSGIPFYGYHTKEHQFLKIYFYNPLIMKKASSLLQNGNIFEKVYQLHEAHIPFILQFMIDYNLHGMNYISLSQIQYRADAEYCLSDVPAELILPLNIAKISTCKLEVDGSVEHIVNRYELAMGQDVKNPGIAALWEDEKQRRRNKNEDSQISPCLSQTRINIPPSSSHLLFKEALRHKLTLSDGTVENTCGDHNSSIYPAEVPRFKKMMSASFVETHSSTNSYKSSFSSTMDDSEISNQSCDAFNDTLNVSLDDTVTAELLQVLNDLGDNVNENEDCILSQTSKFTEESDEENTIDMSLPLAATNTPIKIIADNVNVFSNIGKLDNHISSTLQQSDSVHSEDLLNKCDLLDDPTKIKEHGMYFFLYRWLRTIGFYIEKEFDVSRCVCFKNVFRYLQNVVADINHCVNEVETTISASHSFPTNEVLFNGIEELPNDINKETSENGSDNFRTNVCDSAKRKLKFLDMESSPVDIFFDEEIQPANCSFRKCKIVEVVNANLETEPHINVNEVTVHDTFRKHDTVLTQQEHADEVYNNQISPMNNSQVEENTFIQQNSFLKGNVTDTTIIEPVSSDRDLCSTSKSMTNDNKQKSPDANDAVSYDNVQDKGMRSTLPKKFTDHLTVFKPFGLHSSQELFTQSDHKVLVPKFNPPSKEMVLNSLQEYKIPETIYRQPFYSNVADVTGEVQIGHHLLNINSTTSNIPEFNCLSINDNLVSFRNYQIKKINCNEKQKSIKASFCQSGKCIVTTAKFPPSRKQVQIWIQEQATKVDYVSTKQSKEPKLRIFNSPRACSEDEDSISISPFTSSNESVSEAVEISQQTPKSSRKSKSHSQKQLFKNKLSGSLNLSSRLFTKCKKKRNKSISESLEMRKSLLQSQFLHNLSPSDKANNSWNITEATHDNSHGFLMCLENLQKAKSILEYQNLTTLAMELHIQTRSDFKPNPEFDEIKAIFYMLNHDAPSDLDNSNDCIGIIVNDSNNVTSLHGSGITCDVIYVNTEIDLVNTFVESMKIWDPDILAGYEVELLSWGYLLDRATTLKINLQSLLSRTQIKPNFLEDDFNSGLKLTGRVILDVWRLMRHEIALQSYTFENVIFHILHKRLPLYSFKELTSWWENNKYSNRHNVIHFYICRVKGIMELLERLDIIGRTSELARLFGIQFYEVLSRGSQFRVESMMLRLAKPVNYVAVSPSVQQRAKMKAPEFIALILEPESKCYADPVIVLDFQSLYPSIMIAYNYCFSTCIGRVENLGKNSTFTFGATQLKLSRSKLKHFVKKDLLNFSPCGAVFVKSQVRAGILPRMLTEILEARLMVKKSMKQNKDNKVLQRVLHSRQLGLKLIANVTYGYTAANFSGRMPLVELADSVVSKGRETLLSAIKLIEKTPKWDAKVIYGDTDSIFVLVPGRTRQSAFEIGAEIASAVTDNNPSPVKLKLEKVYQPCILQTKKRYVGYKYESPEDIKPEFCAKGIETVRRDGCPAVSKMLEKSIRILFDTCDVSLVRKYVIRQFNKLLTGQISLQDLTFAKEYRGMSNYRPGACVPSLELTRKWMSVDKRNEPRRGERVPYVIINGPPGLPLIKLVRSPRDFFSDSSLLPNILYYITRVIIPPLNRCFLLIGADLNVWFNSMPRKQMRIFTSGTPDSTNKKRAISHYFSTTSCFVCGQQTQNGICTECCNSPQNTVAFLYNKINHWEQCQSEITKICQACCGHIENTLCISLDCPILYGLRRANQDLQQGTHLRQTVAKHFSI